MFAKTIQNKRKQRKTEFATNEETKNKRDSSANVNGVKFM